MGPYNPLKVEEGDTASMLCEVKTVSPILTIREIRFQKKIKNGSFSWVKKNEVCKKYHNKIF